MEVVAPRERELANPKPLASLIGDAKSVVRQKSLSSAPKGVNQDAILTKLLRARGVDEHDGPTHIPVNDRSYDLVLLSDWENHILYDPPDPRTIPSPKQASEALTKPLNRYLNSDEWLQTIIWDPKLPYRDFRELPFDPEPISGDAAIAGAKSTGEQTPFPSRSALESYDSGPQTLYSDRGSALGSTMQFQRISSTCRTTFSMKSRRKNLVCVRPSDNLLWSTRIQRRSYSYPL